MNEDYFVGLKPEEYQNPDWAEPDIKYVHDWRAYIGADLRAMWSSFSDEQKYCIAKNAQLLANDEDWD